MSEAISNNFCRLILASGSPRRKVLLEKLGLKFEVVISNFVETIDTNKPAQELVVELAAGKAFTVADRVKQESSKQDAIILGGDTTVVIDGSYLECPKSKDDAVKMLNMLSGKWHEVFTGVALIKLPSQEMDTAYDVTRVKMRELSPNEIKAYIDTDEPMDVAGAYALQGVGAAFVERLEGCVSNVIGFPLPLIVRMLREAGISVLGEPDTVLSVC